MQTPSNKTYGIAAASATLFAIWTYIQPAVNKYLEMRDEWTKVQWRIENAETRLQRLEDRGRWFHGRPTQDELKSEARH